MRFELDINRRNVPDHVYLADLRSVATRLNKKSITIQEYEEHGTYHPRSVRTRFSIWPSALRRAGLEVQYYNGGVDIGEALQDLKDVAARLQKPTLTQSEYRQHGRWSSKPLVRHFGSWLAALAAAGLCPSRAYAVSNGDLFRNLESMWRRLGRQPTYIEVLKPFSDYAAATYAQRFGSWRKALEAFVAFMESPEPDFPVAETETKPAPPRTLPRRRAPRAVNWRLRFLVMRRDHFRCKLCGATSSAEVELEPDHIVPYSKGGETVLENLQTLCEKCNIGKSDLAMDDATG